MKTYRTLSLLISFIFLILGLISPAVYGATCPFHGASEDSGTPQDFARRFYGWVFFKDTIEARDLESIKSCFEESFYKNFLLKMSIQGDGEIAEYQFDYNPFTQGQDAPHGFKVLDNNKANKAAATTVEVPVQLVWSNKPSIMNVILIKKDHHWEIANIKGNHDLKKESDEAAKNLNAPKNKQ